MATCFFVSDLHGHKDRYEKLFGVIREQHPDAVFLGGDLFPHSHMPNHGAGADESGFVKGYLAPGLIAARQALGDDYPAIFLIMGNDDARFEEAAVLEVADLGVWQYAHGARLPWETWSVYGYAYTPPSPFRLKDWERYDVSRNVEPGCISPEEGIRSVSIPEREMKYATIAEDLRRLAGDGELDRAIILFHAPPYRTNLDRAALDGRMIDHAPVDVNIGSIAIRRFIETRQPLLTLHGHVHESATLTGSWRDTIGKSICLSAAHDGPELALVRFDPDLPSGATRVLI